MLIFIADFIKSVFSIIIISYQIIYCKLINKKTILFFHSKKELTLIHTEYIENLFYKKKNYKVFFGCQININKNNYYFIKPTYLNFLFGIDLFISNNVSDQFTPYSEKIYIHHDVYDTPLVEKKKENILKKRLLKYNYIIVASEEGKKLFEKFLNKSNVKIIIKRYLKLDYLIKKISKKKSNRTKNILIAPTNFKSFPNLTMQKEITKIAKILLKKNYFITYRPHPSNLNDKEIFIIKKNFQNYKNFIIDKSNNYLNSFNKSDLMITDLSGTAYTYLLLTAKPVIFYSTNEKYLNNNYYKNLGYFLNRNKIGFIVTNIKNLINILDKRKIKIKKNREIIKFRKKFFKKKKLNIEFFLKKNI